MSDSRDSREGPPNTDQPGFGNQPGYWRFKGSGNLAGRPKGSKNRKTIVREVMQETHPVTENGRKVRRSKLELVLLLLRKMALEGKSHRAAVEFQKLLEEYEPQVSNEKVGVIIVPGMAGSLDEYKAELGRLTRNAPR